MSANLEGFLQQPCAAFYKGGKFDVCVSEKRLLYELNVLASSRCKSFLAGPFLVDVLQGQALLLPTLPLVFCIIIAHGF